VIVTLTGWDLVVNLRRRLVVDVSAIRQVEVGPRSEVERLVDHRVLGIGTHDGERRPNRRRVGTMLGRGVSGKQFWAVPAGDGSHPLVVIDLSAAGDLARVVLGVDDPEEFAAAIDRARRA